MQEFELKRGHYKSLEGDKLKTILEQVFGNAVKLSAGEEGRYRASFGALKSITVWLKDKHTLCVDTEMDRTVDDNVGTETLKRYNKFMYLATGFTSKQRRERLQKRAREGKL